MALSTCMLLAAGCASSGNGGGTAGLDHAELNVAPLAKDTPIHVHAFSTDQLSLDNFKSPDTARTVLKTVPHLLAVDIVETLREAGFTRITLDETEGGAASGSLNLTGRFTSLDPGDQVSRIMIGFGLGASEVCVEGEITDASGKTLGSFSSRESGIGWGASEPQMESEAHSLGQKIGHFVGGAAH